MNEFGSSYPFIGSIVHSSPLQISKITISINLTQKNVLVSYHISPGLLLDSAKLEEPKSKFSF